MKTEKIEYSALRSRPEYENERVTIHGIIEPGETPIQALEAAKKIVDEFLGPSMIITGNGPIIPDVDISKINLESKSAEQVLDRRRD